MTCIDSTNPCPDMSIKSSGSTTEFDTGAHRDSREGKGRCDLLPLEVVRDYLGDGIVGYIANFMQDRDTADLYDALSAFADDAYEGNPYTMFLEVAKHYEEGGKRYGDNNWKNGMPVHIYIDSALRHYFKWARSDKDEPHARAFVWNLMCCIWEVDCHNKED